MTDPFEFFKSPWWKDMNSRLSADGWPMVVVPLNCMVRDAKKAYEAECARSKKLVQRIKQAPALVDAHAWSDEVANAIAEYEASRE